MYKGSNAEKLHNMSLYDLLCRMQEGVDNIVPGCVVDYITGEKNKCRYSSCADCIAKWLNEPYEGGSKNA